MRGLLRGALAGVALAGLAGGAQAQTSAPAPLIAQSCAGCHGQAGAGNGSVPKISGQPRDVFIANWAAFKSGQRPATIMNRVATGFTDAEVSQLADYFSKLK